MCQELICQDVQVGRTGIKSSMLQLRVLGPVRLFIGIRSTPDRVLTPFSGTYFAELNSCCLVNGIGGPSVTMHAAKYDSAKTPETRKNPDTPARGYFAYNAIQLVACNSNPHSSPLAWGTM